MAPAASIAATRLKRLESRIMPAARSAPGSTSSSPVEITAPRPARDPHLSVAYRRDQPKLNRADKCAGLDYQLTLRQDRTDRADVLARPEWHILDHDMVFGERDLLDRDHRVGAAGIGAPVMILTA